MSQPNDYSIPIKDIGGNGAVLLGDQILDFSAKYNLIIFSYEEYNANGQMIERKTEDIKDIDERREKIKDIKQIKAASCRLTVGNNYQIEGKRHKLKKLNDDFDIPPFEVAIIETREKFKMPRNLIGRWNIKVGLAYEGLLWVGGPQVDPGYEGHLYCPIYNLSNKKVNLRKGQELAVIDFVATTEYTDKIKYKFEQKRIDIYDYPILESALAIDMKHRVDNMERQVENLRKEFDTKTENMYSRLFSIVGPIITTLSLLFALFGIFVTTMRSNAGKPSDGPPTTADLANNPLLFSESAWIYILAVMNFVTLLFVVNKDFRNRSWMKKYGKSIVTVIVILGLFILTYLYLFR